MYFSDCDAKTLSLKCSESSIVGGDFNMLSIKETKERFIEFLYSRGEYIRAVTRIEYQTRCPYCGDSRNRNTGHLYLEIDVENTFNVPYYCQKCPAHGIVTPDVLEMLGNTDEELLQGFMALNKLGKYTKGFVNEDRFAYFDRTFPEDYRYTKKLEYVNNRLQYDFSIEDYKKMKIITSLYDFLIANDIKESLFDRNMRMILEKDYIGFLSAGNSHILFRDTTETHKKYSWIKYPIEERCRKNRAYYGISSEIDIFTKDYIILNLSEGVMDAIGVCYHLGYNRENTFNLAVLGQHYNAIIRHMIAVGCFGSNIIMNIYSDNDKNYSDHTVMGTTMEYFFRYLKKYKPLFKRITLNYNLLSKDYGIGKESICIKKINM